MLSLSKHAQRVSHSARPMQGLGLAAALLSPALILFATLMAAPVGVLIEESLKPFVSGKIGGEANAGLTLHHYAELLDPAYALYFADTFRIGLIVTVAGLLLGYPVAYLIARQAGPRLRTALIAGLIGMLFLSLIVRVYAIMMTFGPTGPLKGFGSVIGIAANSRADTEMMVVLGLLHTVFPLIAITLIGTVQNVNPRLEDAALSLGAPRWKAFAAITLPLSVPGILSAAILAYAFCISNFVVPLILGKGFVLFVSNLIYARFSEVNNYPSGGAISVIMMAVSLLLFYGMMQLVRARWQETGR
jgi:putative spermidine/putrescine transport system permease protein